MTDRELLKEIDATLDQLIKNAAALQEVRGDPLCHSEMAALKKAQESLLSRLLHLDHSLKKERISLKKQRAIEEKRLIFSALHRPSRKSKIPSL